MLNFKLLAYLVIPMAPLFVNAQELGMRYKDMLTLGCENIPACLELLFSAAMTIAFPVAVVFIMWSGFLFVSAGGNPEKIKTARTTLLWAIIGLVIVIGAWALAVAFQESLTAL